MITTTPPPTTTKVLATNPVTTPSVVVTTILGACPDDIPRCFSYSVPNCASRPNNVFTPAGCSTDNVCLQCVLYDGVPHHTEASSLLENPQQWYPIPVGCSDFPDSSSPQSIFCGVLPTTALPTTPRLTTTPLPPTTQTLNPVTTAPSIVITTLLGPCPSEEGKCFAFSTPGCAGTGDSVFTPAGCSTTGICLQCVLHNGVAHHTETSSQLENPPQWYFVPTNTCSDFPDPSSPQSIYCGDPTTTTTIIGTTAGPGATTVPLTTTVPRTTRAVVPPGSQLNAAVVVVPILVVLVVILIVVGFFIMRGRKHRANMENAVPLEPMNEDFELQDIDFNEGAHDFL
jgi:hypothetical protein